MKRTVPSRPVLSVTVRRGLALWLGAPWVMVSVTVLAQDDPGDSPPPSADSQAVDEEEAEFRRRMELEERSGDERSSPVDVPDIVEVDPADAPEDPLPPMTGR